MYEELTTSSNDDLILFDMVNQNNTVGSMGTSLKVMGWIIRDMFEEDRVEVQTTYRDHAVGKRVIQNDCTTDETESDEVDPNIPD